MTTQEQTENEDHPSKIALIANNRKAHWREWVLAGLTIMMFLIGVLVLPFVVERSNSSSFNFDESSSATDAAETDKLYIRYEQFNVDINSYLRSTRHFPMSLYDDPIETVSYRYRALYTGLSSVIPRLTMFAKNFPDLEQGLKEPAPLRLTFLSMLSLNLIIFVIVTQVFYHWMRLHFSQTLSFVISVIMVLSPKWFIASNTVSTRIVGFAALIVIPYLFDRYLLGDNPPSWKQIAVVSFIAGLIFLGKTQYDAIIICWFWATYQRRWKVLFGTMTLFIVPLLLWIGLLGLLGLEYYNHDMVVYRQGVWMLDMIRDADFWAILPLARDQAASSLGGLFTSFSVFILFLSLWGFMMEKKEMTTFHQHRYLLAMIVFIGFPVIVGHPAGGQKFSYGSFPIIYPVAGIGLISLARNFDDWIKERMSGATWGFIALIVVFILLNTAFTWRYYTVRTNFVWNPNFSELGILFEKITNLFVLTGPEY